MRLGCNDKCSSLNVFQNVFHFSLVSTNRTYIITIDSDTTILNYSFFYKTVFVPCESSFRLSLVSCWSDATHQPLADNRQPPFAIRQPTTINFISFFLLFFYESFFVLLFFYFLFEYFGLRKKIFTIQWQEMCLWLVVEIGLWLVNVITTVISLASFLASKKNVCFFPFFCLQFFFFSFLFFIYAIYSILGR